MTLGHSSPKETPGDRQKSDLMFEVSTGDPSYFDTEGPAERGDQFKIRSSGFSAALPNELHGLSREDEGMANAG